MTDILRAGHRGALARLFAGVIRRGKPFASRPFLAMSQLASDLRSRHGDPTVAVGVVPDETWAFALELCPAAAKADQVRA